MGFRRLLGKVVNAAGMVGLRFELLSDLLFDQGTAISMAVPFFVAKDLSGKDRIMNYLPVSSWLKRVILALLMILAAAVLAGVLLIPAAQAASLVFVRPGGDDVFCSGTANVDYSPAVAPACAVKTIQRAIDLAAPDGQVSLFTGSEMGVFPPGGLTPAEGVISAMAVATLTVSKTDTPDPAQATQPLTYTILITNPPGSLTDNSISLIDTLGWQANAVSFKSVTSTHGSCAGTLLSNVWIINCGSINLAANQTATVTVVVTPTAAGLLSNGVNLIPSNTNLAGGSDTELTEIIGQTNLTVSKLDSPDPVVVNTPLTYSLIVTNFGPNAAAPGSTILTDTLPAGVTLGPLPPGCIYSSPTLTCSLDFLDVNSSTIISLVVTPTAVGVITNTAGITASGGAVDPVPGNNTAVQTTTVIFPPNSPQLSKDDGVVCAIPGQLIDYTITVTNPATTSVSSLVLTEFLPANTTFQGPLGIWPPAPPFTRSLGTLNAGAVTQTVFSVLVNPAIPTTTTAITNQVNLTPPGLNFTLTTPINHAAPDLYVIKNDNIEMLSVAAAKAIARLEQKIGSQPWLEAVKGAPISGQAASAAPGDTISYTIAFGNASSNPVSNVIITETLPANTSFVGPVYWTQVNANTFVYTVSTLSGNSGGVLDFRVKVANPFPSGTPGVTNTVQIGASATECDSGNNISREFTPIGPGQPVTTTLYLPIIVKNYPPPSSTPTSTPVPLSYVSDVKADPDTNQVFVASPRHDWVYVINGSSDSVARNVPVGNGPTGLTVQDSSNKVFAAHQYGANNWHPGFMAFGVNDTGSHATADGGYAGAAPVKTAGNASNGRVYVANYFDKLAVFDGNAGALETRLGWVVQKAFQGAYGIDASSATNRVYLATRDTGELVIFDGNGDRLLQANYIPTHVKPPQACSLATVAVNETTGHVFVPCPQLSNVFVLQENQVSVLDLETRGALEKRDGNLALVVSSAAAPWIAEISIPGGAGLGEEGIAAVNAGNGYVFITNARNNSMVVLQDGGTPSYVTTVTVGTKPQGVDVNPATQKVYVGNTGSNTVTVLNAASPFGIIKTISLTP